MAKRNKYVYDHVKRNHKDMTEDELQFSIKAIFNEDLDSNQLKKLIGSAVKESQRYVKTRQNFEEWAQSNPFRYRANSLYQAALTRTKEKRARGLNVPFDITVEWIEERLKRGICECSGLDLYIKSYTKKENDAYEKIHPRAASLDQINAGKGYTKDNVRVICDSFNKMFNDKTDLEIYDLVKCWIEHYEKNIIKKELSLQPSHY